MIADASAFVPPELITLGLALTALSGTFYFVWGFVGPVITWIKSSVYNLMYREIEIHISNPEYVKFNSWLEKNHCNTYFQRAFKVAHTWGPMSEHDEWDNESEENEDREGGSGAKLVAGFGSVFIKKSGLPLVVVTRRKEEGKQVFKETETLTFKLFSLTESPIHRFFAEVTKIRESTGPFVYSCSHSYWSKSGRPKHVMTPLGEGAEQFMDEIETFLSRREEYKKKGVSYKRGFVLYGGPGTGKSSVVAYAANRFGMNVYLLNSETIAKFEENREDIKPGSIILIEDIDMTVAGSSRKNIIGSEADSDQAPETDAEIAAKIISQETIRDFLNTLDGICEFEGSIIVATTNKPNVLDPALVRPGRLDCSIEIGAYTFREQIQHINRFYETDLSPDDYTHVKPQTVADLQFMCTTHMNDVEATLKML